MGTPCFKALLMRHGMSSVEVGKCPGTSLKGGLRKVFLVNPSCFSDFFFPRVRAEGLPVTEPNQAMMIAQITNIYRQPN